MGLDLTLFMADWERLRALPAGRRADALEDAVRPPGAREEDAWCAEYVFSHTTGAYRPHRRAGDGWDDMRMRADASVRAAMDAFLDGLIWYADPATGSGERTCGGLFPPAAGPRLPRVLLVCPPSAVPGKVRAWERVEPRLEELRGPFAAECAGWAGRPDTFGEFTALLREWADATGAAARRGWGLVGLS
ncbi:hypothetical protein ACWDQO_32285 [Streptomyces sp. NPDC003703]|uniref:hypothetical protein n=1 Tax=Streptomyces sp. NPDC003283 TaxID=3364681 RepID=UPI003691DB54